MISITNRRFVSMASASALIATIVVAGAPAAAMAATPTSGPTGFFRDGIELTAKQIGGVATGDLNADGFDIAVYNPSSVINANIHGAKYFGVVVNGATTVNTTTSKIHDIGDSPFDGMQRGRAILYINGAHGNISGNQVYDFQKTGIEISGLNAAGDAPSANSTYTTVQKNVVTGEGHIDYIAQNGIVIWNGASALVKDNAVSKLYDTDADWEATGLLNYQAGKITVSGNTFSDTEVRIDGVVTANVQGSATTTLRYHGIRVDLRSAAKPSAEAVLGTKLDWKIKVDGALTLHLKQGFSDHAAYLHYFKAGSGRHTIKVLRNDIVVKTTVVRA